MRKSGFDLEMHAFLETLLRIGAICTACQHAWTQLPTWLWSCLTVAKPTHTNIKQAQNHITRILRKCFTRCNTSLSYLFISYLLIYSLYIFWNNGKVFYKKAKRIIYLDIKSICIWNHGNTCIIYIHDEFRIQNSISSF